MFHPGSGGAPVATPALPGSPSEAKAIALPPPANPPPANPPPANPPAANAF
jgi:hypothetical protein